MCKTEQSAQRQRQLEKGLLQLMKVRRFEEITISDLCEKMKIPRKSFYRYFSGKDGALFALLDHTMLEFFESGLRTGGGGTALGDLEEFFRYWYGCRDLLSALERSQLSGILVQRAIVLAQREGMIPKHIRNWSADLQGMAMSFAVCGLLSMVIQWHHQGYLVSPEEMTTLAVNLLTQPLVRTS